MASGPRKTKRPTRRTAVTEPAGFKTLSEAEQIRYLQKLWDRIAQGPKQLPVRERLADYRRDPIRARPAHDVLRNLTSPDR